MLGFIPIVMSAALVTGAPPKTVETASTAAKKAPAPPPPKRTPSKKTPPPKKTPPRSTFKQIPSPKPVSLKKSKEVREILKALETPLDREQPQRLRDVLEGTDQTGSAAAPPDEARLSEPSAKPGEEREEPNYEGREPESTTAGDVLIWFPRILALPVHLTLKYLVRYPIVGALTWAEENYVFNKIGDFLTWRDGKSGVFPNFLIDFGLRPSVGLTFFQNDLPRGNNFTASFSVWANEWLSVQARNETTIFSDDSGRFALFGGYVSRPDFVFFGIGPATIADRNFYRSRSGQVGFEVLSAIGELNRANFRASYLNLTFSDSPLTSDGNLDLNDAPGFTQGYQLVDSRLDVIFDSRDPDTEFSTGTGLRFEAFGGFSFDPSETGRNFVRWGAEGSSYIDVTGYGHVLAFRMAVAFLERTGSDNPTAVIPFTELNSLGGVEVMRGFLANRFRGDSTIAMTFSYRYPIWSLLDAEIFAGFGNAFDGHLRGLSFERLHFNSGIAIRTNLARDTALAILIGIGSTRLDADDFSFTDSARFSFGFQQGF